MWTVGGTGTLVPVASYGGVVRTEPVDDVVTADLFEADVRRWADRIGVEVKEIHIRDMTRKWASASTSGRITFDVDLLEEPIVKRNEVIVHELVHLKVGHHGPLFRNLVRAHLDAQNGEAGPQNSAEHA